jgi:hypothetical protein
VATQDGREIIPPTDFGLNPASGLLRSLSRREYGMARAIRHIQQVRTVRRRQQDRHGTLAPARGLATGMILSTIVWLSALVLCLHGAA